MFQAATVPELKFSEGASVLCLLLCFKKFV